MKINPQYYCAHGGTSLMVYIDARPKLFGLEVLYSHFGYILTHLQYKKWTYSSTLIKKEFHLFTTDLSNTNNLLVSPVPWNFFSFMI